MKPRMDKMYSALVILMTISLILSGISIAFFMSGNNFTSTSIEDIMIERVNNPLRPATRGDIALLQENMGIREPGVNYNVMIGDKGTGFAPPTQHEYDKLASRLMVSENRGVFTVGEGDHITELLTQESNSLTSEPPSLQNPPSFMLRDQSYFPPIGDQGGQGSCAAFAGTHYALSTLIAKTYGYNINTYGSEIASTANPPTHQDYMMSPGWSYNMANNGADEGSMYFGLWDLSDSVGNSNWRLQPYDAGDFSSWGSEAAFRNAAQYRSNGYEFIDMNEFDFNTVLNYIKTSLNEGYVIGIALDAYGYPTDMWGAWDHASDIISSQDWSEDAINHANAIIGYDDSRERHGEQGAFHVANTWGSWGPYGSTHHDTGTFWMTYECVINHFNYPYIFRYTGDALYDNTAEKSPELLGTWRFSDNRDRDPDVYVGISNRDQGEFSTEERWAIWDGASSTLRRYPNFLSLDLTEYVDRWDNGNGDNFFALHTGETRGTTSTISEWTVEHYGSGYVWNDGGASATRYSSVSPEAPASNPCTMWTTFTSTTGRVLFDQEKYGVDDTVVVTVEDQELIGMPSLTIQVTSPRDSLLVSMSESARYSHIWQGTFNVETGINAATLQVAGGDTISASYDDGGTPRTTTAEIDDTPPVIVSGPSSISKLATLVTWESDELATSRVNYGLDQGNLDLYVESDRFTRNHRIALDGLDSRERTYYYEIIMVNEAGLQSTYTGYEFISSDFDDVEAGNVGWTFGGPKSRDGRWAPRQHNVYEGEWSWNFGNSNYGNGWWDWMISPEINTGGWSSGEWTWWHAYKIEKPSGTDYWDGFVVEVRRKDGETWDAWDRAFPDTSGTSGGGYDGTVYPDYDDTPFAGEQIFGGYSGSANDGSWVDERVDLSDWLPADFLQVRYYFASDDYVTEYGLDIDNIRITSLDGDPPQVSLIQPNGGETLAQGAQYEIQWTSTAGTGTIEDADISYSTDAGTSWTFIDNVATTAGAGNYMWTVPNTPSDQCRVRVRVNADDGLSATDSSDGNFEILGSQPPQIDVTRPTLGMEWKPGNREDIEWTITDGDGTTTHVNLWYSDDAGDTWTEIATDLDHSTGAYDWRVPNTPSEACIIRARVYDDIGGVGEGYSAIFTILELVYPEITLLRPTGGELWYSGNSELIQWESVGNDFILEEHSIQYSTDNGLSWTFIASGLPGYVGDPPEPLGEYLWDPVMDLNNQEVLLRVNLDAQNYDFNTFAYVSDGSEFFTIEGPDAAAPLNVNVEHYGVTDDITTETRYMRGDQHTVNDLETYQFGVTQSTNALSNLIDSGTGPNLNDETINWGIRVYVRNSAGGMTEITGGSPEAIVTRTANGQGIQTTTWNCPETGISDTDALVVRVLAEIEGRVPWTVQSQFITEQLGSDQLEASTWTINYHTEYLTGQEGGGGGGPPQRYTRGWFHWGDSTVNSNIEGISYSSFGELGTDDNRITWDASPDDPGRVTAYEIFRSTSSTGPWNYLNTVAADGSASYSYVDEGAGTADTTVWWYTVVAIENIYDGAASEPAQEPGGEQDTFDIILVAGGAADGWNLVSFNLELGNTNLETVLSGIEGSYDKVMYYDAAAGQWRSHVPGRAARFNNLDNWNHHMGLWIHVTVGDTLTVEGSAPVSTDITLYPGWNMVGLPSDTIGNHGLPGQVSVVGHFSADAEYNMVYDYNPAAFDFEPGHGYMVYLDHTEPVVWTVDY